jgi:hypothetical protein
MRAMRSRASAAAGRAGEPEGGSSAASFFAGLPEGVDDIHVMDERFIRPTQTFQAAAHFEFRLRLQVFRDAGSLSRLPIALERFDIAG